MHLWHFLLTKFSLISISSGWIFLQFLWPHSITNNKLTAAVTKELIDRYFFLTTLIFFLSSLVSFIVKRKYLLTPPHLQRNHQQVYFSYSLQYSTSSPEYTGGSCRPRTLVGVYFLRCECWPTCVSWWWGRGRSDRQYQGSGRLG